VKRSKAYRKAADLVDRAKVYSPLEAAKLVKETSPTRFDATIEVALRLGVDPRKADQMVRGTVNLPHGTGKTARVLVFANGDRASRPSRRAPTTWAATTCSSASRVGGPTSTPSSPRPTSWARSAGSARCSARAA